MDRSKHHTGTNSLQPGPLLAPGTKCYLLPQGKPEPGIVDATLASGLIIQHTLEIATLDKRTESDDDTNTNPPG